MTEHCQHAAALVAWVTAQGRRLHAYDCRARLSAADRAQHGEPCTCGLEAALKGTATPPDYRTALDELEAAVRDAERRYRAGDFRAMEATMLRAALSQAQRVLGR